jgi:hypothetical protein
MKFICALVLLGVVSPLVACGDQVVGWPEDESVDFAICATAPRNGEVGVVYNAVITATFNRTIDPETLTTDTFTLFDGTNFVEGEVSCVGVIAMFAPHTDLDSETVYAATIKGEAMDLGGNKMVRDYVWIFGVGAGPDVIESHLSTAGPEPR